MNSLSPSEQYTPKYIASIVGKIVSCELACGILPKLHLHPYFKWIAKTITSDHIWRIPKSVSKTVIDSIKKSFDCVKRYSGRLRPKSYNYKYISSTEVSYRRHVVNFTGDGNEMFGAFYQVNEENNYQIIKFSSSERELSSSYRELLVLHECIKQNKQKYATQNICYKTDSRVLHFWATGGSVNPFIADKLINIFTWAHDNDIILDVVWAPRTDQSIQLCDNTCKADTDEFTLPDNIYMRILETLDVKVSVDLFASTVLHRCELFYTKKPSLGSIGANSLRFDWSSKETLFCFPPKNLMFKVFSKIESAEEVNLVLVFLKTNGDTIFKLFTDGDQHFKSYVKNCLTFDSRIYSPFFQNKFTISIHKWYVLHIVKGHKPFHVSIDEIIKI